VLYLRAKFGEDRTTRAGCRSENWCFLYVTLGLPARGGYSLNKYCVTVYESVLMQFLKVSSEWIVLSHALGYIVLISVASWRYNFREIAVKNCERSKNRQNDCAHQGFEKKSTAVV